MLKYIIKNKIRFTIYDFWFTVLFFFFSLFCFEGFGQDKKDYYQKDAELWNSFEVKKKWGDLTFSMEQALRLNQNISDFKTAFSSLGLKYELKKWLILSSNYRYSFKIEGENNQRLDFNLNCSKRIKPFTFSNRFRYQYRISNGDLPEKYLRNKLQIEIYKKKEKVTKNGKIKKVKPKCIPYLMGEIFYNLDYSAQQFDAFRLSGGLQIDVGKKKELKLFYIYEQEFQVYRPQKSYIYGLSYNLSL